MFAKVREGLETVNNIYSQIFNVQRFLESKEYFCALKAKYKMCKTAMISFSKKFLLLTDDLVTLPHILFKLLLNCIH